MKKIILPILILAFIMASGWMLRDTWAGLASNQTVSRAALQDGINSLSLSRAGAVVPSDSERNITKNEVNTYIYLDPNNAGYAARASNQLVIKSDITPLNDSTQLWSNSGVITSVASACAGGATGTSFEAHYVAPLAVNSYMATFPYQGDARPQYFYNSANASVYQWSSSSTITSITGCGSLQRFVWVHYAGSNIVVDMRTAGNGGGTLTTVNCADTITADWTSTDFPGGTSGQVILPANTQTVTSKLDPGGTINSITLASHTLGTCGSFWFTIQHQ